MKMLHSFKLKEKEGSRFCYDVIMDGKKMGGVTSATVIVNASDEPMIPRVCLTFMAENIEVDVDEADVTETGNKSESVNKGGEAMCQRRSN